MPARRHPGIHHTAQTLSSSSFNMKYQLNKTMADSRSKNRLLLNVLRDLATPKPQNVYCIHSITSDPKDGWREITYRRLARAVDFMSWWIDENVTHGRKRQTLGYIGANDIRYVVFILACMKTGNVGLLLSTRNSQQAFHHLLDKTDCNKLLYTPEKKRTVIDIQSSRSSKKPLFSREVPGLWDVFDSDSEPYAFDSKYEEVEDDPVLIIHSSGTTGFPKPVYLTHGYFATIDNMRSLPVPAGRENALFAVNSGGKLRLNLGPLFHFIGIVCMAECIYFETPFVQCPDRPITVDLMSTVMNDTKPRWMLSPPSILEDLVTTPEGLDVLSQFNRIDYGGAPMRAECGKILTERVELQTILGSSETGYTPMLFCKDAEDWDTFEFNPYFAMSLEDAGDGAFELVIPRQENRSVHGIAHTHPDVAVYHTGDLLVPHPTKDGLWKYYGRRDDVIVLSNGEKFNPIEMEKMIEAHRLVNKAVVVGQGRFDAALLIEPNWERVGVDSAATVIEIIMPVIEQANDIAPAHGRILPNRIGIASRDKPFKVTPKQSIMRKAIIADYEDEIDEIYARTETTLVAQLPESTRATDVQEFVHDTVSHMTKMKHVDDEDSIFTMGLDSLHALQLSQTLQMVVKHFQPDKDVTGITSQQIYNHPSVALLSQYLHGLIVGRDSPAPGKKHRSSRISDIVDRFSRGFGKRHTVLLTGSTGSLGSYILYELLLDISVNKVYCLNRSSDALKRQVASFQEKGLHVPSHLMSKAEFIQFSVAEEKMGVDKKSYFAMAQDVDTIIHNAWMVNFNHGIESFEYPHLAGVRRLIDFILTCENNPHLHFISSVSAVGGWTVQDGPSVPEEIIDNPDLALRQGYGESKYVAERMCEAATEQCGIPTSIHRVGQLGGPTTMMGMWNKAEWVPSLIQSSQAIRKIPDSLGPMAVDWVPIDTAGRVIVEIMLSSKNAPTCSVYHIVNPSPSPWSSLIPTIQRYCNVTPTSLEDWIDCLQSSSSSMDDFTDKPALKLLDFFEGLLEGQEDAPRFEVKRSEKASKRLRELSAIDGEMMDNWMKQWGFNV